MKRLKTAAWALALMLSIGSLSMTAMAAEGWSQSGSQWIYYDSNGDRVYNTWKKGADNQWRYLDSDGVMATNTWVEDDYYVDADGVMYTDQWLKVTDEDGNQEWYYFSSTGKAIKDNWKKIDDKWYHFDSDGRMETGWIEDDMYYCNASGEMLTGWQQLYSPDKEDSDSVTPGYDSLGYDGGKNWYYFSATGKKYLPDEDESGDEYGTRKIEGYYYCLDEDGAMQTGWKEVRSKGGDTIRNYMYFGEDGKGKIGWYSMYPPEDLSGYDGDVEWFYFSNSGEPKASESDRLEEDDIVRINGKKYLFNNLGNPVYGLRKVYISDDDWTAFYFGDKETSSVQTGKMTITEDDGTKGDFYFSSSGRGYTGIRDGYLYYAGKKQKALDGVKYACYHVNGKNYVVNKSGKVMDDDEVKNEDGVKFVTNGSGELISADGETDISGYVEEPIEPCWDED